MIRRDTIDLISKDSKSVHTALSAHEKEIFEGFLQKQIAEKAQTYTANDTGPDKLRYLFAIFH